MCSAVTLADTSDDWDMYNTWFMYAGWLFLLQMLGCLTLSVWTREGIPSGSMKNHT